MTSELDQLRDTFDQAAVGIAVADFEGHLLETNRRCVEFLGYSQEELRSLTFLKLTHPEDLDRTEDLVEKLLSGEIKEYTVEKRYVRKDGTPVWSNTTATILRDSSGNPYRLVGILEDISIRKNAELVAQQMEQQLREESHVLEILNRTGRAIASKLDLKELLQIVTNAATEISGAKFGIFYYKTNNSKEAEFELYTFSGTPRKSVEFLSSLGSTPFFLPAFKGERVVRSNDIFKDEPSNIFTDQLVIRSCVAVPVQSRNGGVSGVLVFGHSKVGVFTKRIEDLLQGIAAQATIAIDNARLYEAAQNELLQRKRSDQILKETQRELLIHKVRLESIIRFSEDAIVTKNLQGVIQSWNPAAERIFGHTEQEAVGKSIHLIIPPELRGEEEEILAKISRGERVEHLETVRLAKDGRRLFISVTSSPVKDDNGKIIGATKIARDVTEQRVRQAAIEQSEAKYRMLAEERKELLARESKARQEVEEANRLKDQFLATLSHELRTPLNAILGWAQLGARNHSNAKQVEDALQIIERNARSQAQIIEDLLDMNRIVSGTLRLEKQVVDLVSIVNEAIETVTPSAQAKQIRIELSNSCDSCPIFADPNRLKQIVWNLLTNAVKFTDKFGLISVTMEIHHGNGTLIIKDSGEGIVPEFLPHIFDRFSQADTSATRRFGGLGLGLSIVRHLVEIHGGEIKAESKGKNAGSTFTITLPLSNSTPDTVHVPESFPQEVLTHIRILVVDDEPDARRLLKVLLEERGAKVVEAASAAEAMSKYTSDTFDLIISDIGMPQEDGYQLIRKIRLQSENRATRTPAIAITAYARTEDRIRALEAGFQSHISKPIEQHELIAVIKSLVSSR